MKKIQRKKLKKGWVSFSHEEGVSPWGYNHNMDIPQLALRNLSKVDIIVVARSYGWVPMVIQPPERAERVNSGKIMFVKA